MNRKVRDRGAPPGPGHAGLVRRLLRTGRGLKGYRPTPRHYSAEPPPAPRGADEVLAAVASRHRPGDAVGLQQVVDCIAVTWEQARAVRDWAQSVGAWPYTRPGPGWSRRKGGAR
jgi:hypothetical protein